MGGRGGRCECGARIEAKAKRCLSCYTNAVKAAKVPMVQRFWKHVDRHGPDECWNWTGSTKSNGYGHLLPDSGRKKVATHRLSWEMHNGPIPEGLFVCHRCDNRACVNPAHLFLGTSQDNVTDMYQKGRNSRANRVSGERCHLSKLTADQVLEIRASGDRLRDIACRYGVHTNSIRAIKSRRVWKHVM